MMLARTSKGAVRSERGTDSWADADEDGLSAMRSTGIVMKMKPALQSRSPTAMMGIEYNRIRRLPIRSISTKAATVRTKFVTATDREVSVGLENPRMLKMVAEKYIKEFWSCC